MEDKSKTVAVTEIRGSMDLTGICAATCPFLATKFDGITPMAFAHAHNHCYRHGEPIEKTLQYQREYCLSPTYDTCPVFLETEKPNPFSLESPTKSETGSRLRYTVPVTAIVLLLLFVALLSWPVLAQSPGQNQATNLPTAVDQIWGLIQSSAQVDQPAAIDKEGETPLLNPDEAARESENGPPAKTAKGSFRAIEYPPS